MPAFFRRPPSHAAFRFRFRPSRTPDCPTTARRTRRKPTAVGVARRPLPQRVGRGDVLVFNNTKVMKARLFGQKASGGKIEALIERVLDAHTALAHIRSSKSPKPGTRLLFDGGIGAEMTAREGELFRLHFDGEETVYRLLEQHGRPTATTRAATKPCTPNTKVQWPRLPQACTSPIRCWRNSKPKACAWRR